MNYLLEVCLAVCLTIGATPSLGAQSNAEIPTLQKGISVQMPVARSAVLIPEADHEDALVVTITEDGNVFVRLDLADPAALAGRIAEALSSQAEKKLYIKADARAPYAQVVRVLSAVRSAGVQEPGLLTAQPGSHPSAISVSPRGLRVFTAVRGSSGSEDIVVQLTTSEQSNTILTINGEPVPPASLQGRIEQLLQKSSSKFIQIEADENLQFADVVELIDVCRSIGAKIVLVTAP